MKISKKNNQGQSMMEMIFSIGILVTAISAIIALNASNINSQKQSEYLIVANNLAREGIEVVRSFRDRNWLAGQNWDKNLELAGSYLPCFNENLNSWAIVPFDSESIDQLFISNIGVYSCDTTGLPTVYYRHLRLSHICLDISETPAKGTETIKDLCDSSAEKKIGLSVQSVIKWSEHNRPHQVIIEDLLYDWK